MEFRAHLLLGVCISVIFLSAAVSSLAVMSVDFGSEWMKIGIVSPGVPMEIVLNKESKRKTPAVITFRDGTRTFGEDALSLGIRFPKNSYSYLLDLLGKDFNNPIVSLFKKRFPYYDIEEDPVRGTVLFRIDENTVFSPEELVSQLLHKAKDYAEQSANQKIKECVLTVPGFFNYAERQAMLQAAELADLKVLQLINDYSAVALNYGIFHSKEFNETATYILFYDMGASSTTATLVSYQNVKTKEHGFLETHPQSTILGVGYDRTLGGLELQLRLRDHLAQKFNEMKLTPNDVTKNPRSMAKLFKEAGRVKNVLSANNDHFAQIENLLDDKDFRVQVTREEFEKLCEDVFPRVGAPVEKALNMAGLTLDVVSYVVLVGAGTRVPKVQEELQKVVKMELSKNLNTDEAATMGAVYKAADLSKGFKVKKFLTKDAVLYPIQVVFERITDSGDKKSVKRTLFNLMNPYPQKKIITFNKYTDDFKFNVNYADLDHLTPEQLLALGNLNITEVQLTGIAAAIKKNQGENTEFKGIKAHFQMDESGLLQLLNVELTMEKTVPPEDDESTLSKLGNTISNLFKSEETTTQTPEEKTEDTTTPKPAEESTAESNKTDTEQNVTSTTPPPVEQGTEKKPKLLVIKENIESSKKSLGLSALTKEQLSDARKKIEKLNAIDREILARETALNNLESFVIDTQNKLTQDEFVEASTKEEVEKIQQTCSQINDWLYDDGADAKTEQYLEKLDDIKKLTYDLFSRVYEHKERPEALATLRQMLNGSETFLNSAKNLTTGKENEVFTEVEITNLEKIITETRDWRDKMVAEQDKKKKYESVVLTVRSLSEKMGTLDREVKYLVNKLKIWRPKTTTPPPPTPTKEKPVETEETPKPSDTDADKTAEAETEKKEESSENTTNPPQEEEPIHIESLPVEEQSEDDEHQEL